MSMFVNMVSSQGNFSSSQGNVSPPFAPSLGASAVSPCA